MAILISANGLGAKQLEPVGFDNEDFLQQFILDNPSCIPLKDIRDDLNFTILAREVNTENGSIDAFGLDENGEAYIIETKLYKNQDKRRIIAQILDYGAAIACAPDNVELLIKSIEIKCKRHFNQTLMDRIISEFCVGNEDAVQVLKNFQDNIKLGKLRFVVLMDQLDDRLKRLITFINSNSSFSIYGLELEFYKFEQIEVTIPKIFGLEVVKEVSSSANARKVWDKDSFLKSVETHLDDKDHDLVMDMYHFFEKYGFELRWGTGSVRGSFNPAYQEVSSKSLLSIYTDGSLQLNYAWIMHGEKQLAFQTRFIKLFRAILEWPEDESTSRYPTFPIAIWGPKAKEIKNSIIELISIK